MFLKLNFSKLIILLAALIQLVQHLNSNEINRYSIKKSPPHNRITVNTKTSQFNKRQSFHNNNYNNIRYYSLLNQAASINSNSSAKATPYISQLKKIRLLSKNIIEKIHNQNEQLRDDLSECHKQIGRYTRLMVATNARNTVDPLSEMSHTFDSTNLTKASLSSRMFIYNELSFYLLVPSSFWYLNSINR